MVAYAIFCEIGEVGVRWSEHVAQVVVVGRVLVAVAHHEGYRRTRGLALEHSRQQLHAVILASSGCDMALSRFAPVQFALDKVHVDVDARRHTVDHSAHGFTVAFAEGGQREAFSKYVAHCRSGLVSL